jgi:hypothetical protein
MPKGRRARRVIRKIDTWSVLRLSLLFYLALLLTFLVAGVILWQVASTVGITDNLIKLIKKLGDFSSYKINGGVILKDAAIAGLILAVFGGFLNALVCILYNLISDVVGGIRLEMFDEELPAGRGRAGSRAEAKAKVPAVAMDGAGVAATAALPLGGDGNGSDGNGSDGNGSGSQPNGRPSRRERAQAQTS